VPARGRALLIVVALSILAGLVWLWLGQGERSTERTHAPREETAGAATDESAELIPAAPPDGGAEPVPTTDGPRELEPFAHDGPGRTAAQVPAGRTGSLRGRVEVGGEEPFPRVWRIVARPSALLAGRETAVERALEFDDGRQEFELTGLPLGAYDVFAEAGGFNGQVQSIALEKGSEHPYVSLRMIPAGTLEGRVVDVDGVPAEGIPITLFTVEDQNVREAVTDVNGVYRFERLPDGAYEVLIGRATSPLMPERRPLRFQAPRLTHPDIELPPLGAIHVRVVDSLERPLEGVEVRGSGTNGGLVEGTTDYDGRLLAQHLPQGHFRLRLSHPAFDERHARRIAVDVVARKVTEAPVRLGP
jgi:hypothetical protein